VNAKGLKSGGGMIVTETHIFSVSRKMFVA